MNDLAVRVPLTSPSLKPFPFWAVFRKKIRTGNAEWDMFRLGSADEQGLQLGREILQESEQIFIA